MKKKTIIVIEAGHGIPTPGKRSPDPAKFGGPAQMFEGEFNRAISRELVGLLNQNSTGLEAIDLCPGPVNVPIPLKRPYPKNKYSTRRGYIDTLCTWKHRVVHISIHSNAAPGKGWQTPHGARPLIRKDVDNESLLLAQCLHDRMGFETSLENRFKHFDRNLLLYNAGVLKPMDQKRQRLASVMMELGFMTSKRDVMILNSSEGRGQIVHALLHGVHDFLMELGI
jgi:N-acetylmuramoyl-L-alanine amidase